MKNKFGFVLRNDDDEGEIFFHFDELPPSQSTVLRQLLLITYLWPFFFLANRFACLCAPQATLDDEISFVVDKIAGAKLAAKRVEFLPKVPTSLLQT